MSIQPINLNCQTPVCKMPKVRKMEGFKNEGQKLKELYDEYCKNLGGFKMVNGRWMHVHTVLHSDSQAHKLLKEMELRLRSLGMLPPKTYPPYV